LGYVLHHKPRRLRLGDHALKLWDEVPESNLMAVGMNETSKIAEYLARWPADHTVEPACWRVEAAHIAAPQHIRPAHHAEAFKLEGMI